MNLTIEKLRLGIGIFRSKGWPRDLHAAFYAEMAAAVPDGPLTPGYFEMVMPPLTRWKAHRPLAPDALFAEERPLRPQLQSAWTGGVAPQLHLPFEEVDFDALEPWVSLAASIKGVRSPVWASKMSHFLAPSIFVVADGGVLRVAGWTYREWYELAQRSWRRTPEADRALLINVLSDAVGPGWTSDYPSVVKIVELVRAAEVFAMPTSPRCKSKPATRRSVDACQRCFQVPALNGSCGCD